MKTKVSKRILYAYIGWKKSEIYDIHQAYKKPSIAKEDSFQDILREYIKMNGRRMRIINHGIQLYSCGFIYDKIDETTGKKDLTFRYYTVSKMEEKPVRLIEKAYNDLRRERNV